MVTDGWTDISVTVLNQGAQQTIVCLFCAHVVSMAMVWGVTLGPQLVTAMTEGAGDNQ